MYSLKVKKPYDIGIEKIQPFEMAAITVRLGFFHNEFPVSFK